MPARSKTLLASFLVAMVLGAAWLVSARQNESTDDRGSTTGEAIGDGASVALAGGGGRQVEAPLSQDPGPRWDAWVRTRKGYTEESVADAEVWLVDEAGARYEAHTDAAGLAKFSGLRGSLATVAGRATGFGVSDDVLVEPSSTAETAPLDIHLQEAESVAGEVVEASTGRGVIGARVTGLRGGSISFHPAPWQQLGPVESEATTGAGGAFRLEALTKSLFGELRILRVEAVGFRTRWYVPRLQTGAGPLTVRLVEGGSVAGAVTDPDGRPIAGATVVAVLSSDAGGDAVASAPVFQPPEEYLDPWDADESQPIGEDAFAALRATSGADGGFVLVGLGLGEVYTLGATAPGFGAAEPVIDVHAGRAEGPVRVSLRLRPVGLLRVRCMDSQGRPWPGLSVRLVAASTGTGDSVAARASDAEGVARFADLTPGDYYVRVPDEIRGGRELPTVRVESREVDFPLALPGSPARPAGDPFRPQARPSALPAVEPGLSEPSAPARTPNVTARVRVQEGVLPPTSISERARWLSGSAWSGRTWTPDAAGDVTIAWTFDWPKFTFTVEADGFLPIVRDVELDKLGQADLGSLVLMRGETVSGIVVTADGTPLGGVRVRLRFRGTDSDPGDPSDTPPPSSAEAQWDRVATTAENGSFALAGFASGPVDVSIRDRRFLPFEHRLVVPTEDVPVRLVVRTGCLIQVRSVDTDGHPATRRGVSVFDAASEAGRGWEASGSTDLEGLYVVRVKPGSHRIEVVAFRNFASPDPVRSTLSIEEGQTKEVRVVVPVR